MESALLALLFVVALLYGRFLVDVFYPAIQKKRAGANKNGQAQGLSLHSDTQYLNPAVGEGLVPSRYTNDPAVVAAEGRFLNQELIDKGLASVYK